MTTLTRLRLGLGAVRPTHLILINLHVMECGSIVSMPMLRCVRHFDRNFLVVNVHGVLEGTRTELVASITGTEFPRPGEVMPLSPTPGALRYFSPETGQRLA